MIANCLSFIMFFLMLSCTHSSPRKPVARSVVSKYEKTIELNKKLISEENKRIINFINLDTSRNYINSNKGFWYTYVKRHNDAEKPVVGNTVFFEQEIRTLDGLLLYGKNELGLQTYKVDKEPIIKGIQEGIKLMRKGEEIIFVLSSFVAFRMKGDPQNKVGVNEPIVSKIKLINIK